MVGSSLSESSKVIISRWWGGRLVSLSISSLSEDSIIVGFRTFLDGLGSREDLDSGEESAPAMNDLVCLDKGDDAGLLLVFSSIDARGVGSMSTIVRRFFRGTGESSIRMNAARSLTASG